MEEGGDCSLLKQFHLLEAEEGAASKKVLGKKKDAEDASSNDNGEGEEEAEDTSAGELKLHIFFHLP